MNQSGFDWRSNSTNLRPHWSQRYGGHSMFCIIGCYQCSSSYDGQATLKTDVLHADKDVGNVWKSGNLEPTLAG